MESTKRKIAFSKRVLILIALICLSACSPHHQTTVSNEPLTATSVFILTPGEELIWLAGGHDHDFGALSIYVGPTVSKEKFIDDDGFIRERERVTFWVRVVRPENLIDSWFSVREGSVIEFEGYRLRILEIRPKIYQQNPGVKVALLGLSSA